uniref:S100/CaBP-9k-type calcium binding subdomain domain-containing protein n=1 Tax=Ficedula albicollis TaxID=59894 RepID=A0A803V6E3_FICAL
MSPFLDSIATIVGVFQQHARGDGDGSGLSRRRMRELIQREFADSLVVSTAGKGWDVGMAKSPLEKGYGEGPTKGGNPLCQGRVWRGLEAGGLSP